MKLRYLAALLLVVACSSDGPPSSIRVGTFIGWVQTDDGETYPRVTVEEIDGSWVKLRVVDTRDAIIWVNFRKVTAWHVGEQ